MGTGTIKRFTDRAQLSRAAAKEVVRTAAQAIDVRDRFSVALSGGSTPQYLYQLLAEPPLRQQIIWGKAEVFWGDERAVPPEHADSNYRMARDTLLCRVDSPDTQIHRMPAERKDLENAAWDYQVEIARVFGIDPDAEPPRLDIVLLGLGADGHTASLFPYTEALKEETRWVVSNYAPSLDSYRLTMTTRILNHARHVMFLVAGEDKADALRQVLEGPANPNRLPAQLIRPEQGELTWFVDEPAASKLSG
ncbi:MAG: 6-phosphogluconolactonase [Acidiferrobacterales bacterium]